MKWNEMIKKGKKIKKGGKTREYRSIGQSKGKQSNGMDWIGMGWNIPQDDRHGIK